VVALVLICITKMPRAVPLGLAVVVISSVGEWGGVIFTCDNQADFGHDGKWRCFAPLT
jgi:hypothetical protein